MRYDKSDLDGEVRVYFEVVIGAQSPTKCPFKDYEAVVSDEGSEITDFEKEEATQPRKKGRNIYKTTNFYPYFYVCNCSEL